MFLGTIKEVSIGPTSLMSLLTAEYTHDQPVQAVVLLTFLTGAVQLCMALLHLGGSEYSVTVFYFVCSSTAPCVKIGQSPYYDAMIGVHRTYTLQNSVLHFQGCIEYSEVCGTQ